MSNKKNVFITGATSGIGSEFTAFFAKKGYRLILTGRRTGKTGRRLPDHKDGSCRRTAVQGSVKRDRKGSDRYFYQ